MSEVAVINGVTIKKNDIVFIKWKSLNEIMSLYQDCDWTPSCFLEESQIDYHLTALINDGYYKVNNCCGDNNRCNEKRFPQSRRNGDNKREKKYWLDEISIVNHNHSHGDSFQFNENLIEEIRVEHDAADTFFSSKFAISLMKINGALFINGELVTKHDKKLISILENTISDLAIAKMLDGIDSDQMDF